MFEKAMDEKVDQKRRQMLSALEKGMVMVHLDARRPGVLVPANLRGEPHLRLNLSYRFDPPDLSVGEWGVRSTLSFSGSRFTVAIPWSALFAIYSQVTKEIWMYPDEMPAELLAGAVDKATLSTEKPEGASAQPHARPKAVLREIVGEAEEKKDDAEDPPSPPRGRGHLRIVK